MRLFIAISLSDSMRDAICASQDILYRQGIRGNYTPRENLHLTLAFIGEYHDPERLLEIIDDIRFEPFEVKLSGIGSFNDLWWIGIEQSSSLQSYVRRLRHALAEEGIPFDRKRFSPHITILRRASIDMAKLPVMRVVPVSMTVTSVSLMRSDRGKCGMIYTEIM